MVGMFCKSCFGAKLVSYPVCYRALFVQVKSACIGLFLGVIGAAGVCGFSHLVFVYLHTCCSISVYQELGGWRNELCRSLKCFLQGLAEANWVWCGLWIVLWCGDYAFCYQHISFVEHTRIPWWSVNGLSFYALSLLTSVQTADLSISTSCTLRVSSFFSQLYLNMESNQANLWTQLQFSKL